MSNLLAVLDLAERMPWAVEVRERSYELLGEVRDQVVVDVGCGGGRAVAELTERGANAVGVDLDEGMLTAARQRWGPRFRAGDALALPFDDGTVGGYRADKVLHALDRPADAVREARRVLAPGGRAVLLGQDWDTMVIDSDDPATTRRIVARRADRVASPRVARAYRALLLDAGFTDPVVEVVTAVFTGPESLPVLGTLDAPPDWLAEQRDRAERDRLFVAMPMFLVAATAPGRPGERR
ncbi:SAM-dependent methyltransferase [Actinophytocola xinjiangensis]|uniref:SAM-dependent methyltransferase n=1 Tax=Actinophytocola xinjiangensis TaxID=485602 RepID=A0A7Z1AY32_9PSEU|nr:methyltransferase domain-containing protein [Actinophytocola xinjiangensis]OLF11106.1 SAM-dependent methyltransferase [Actinophytocola xinjiangensis]